MRSPKFIVSLLVLFLAVACKKNEDPEPPPRQDWIDLLESHGNYSLFIEAAKKSGLSDQLSGTAYTLLVPGDSVFQNYLDNAGIADIDTWIQSFGEELTQLILNYHIIRGPGIATGQFSSAFLGSNAFNRFGNPISLHVKADKVPIMINSFAEIIANPISQEDLEVHEINRVLFLPAVADLVSHDPEFSLLRQSLQRAGSGMDALLRQDNEAFCFFAPTNRGFQDFISNSNYSDFHDFTQQKTSSEMRDLLLYHMLPNVLRSDNFSNGSYGTRLQGQSIKLIKDVHGGIGVVDGNGNKADLIITDIHALNGIVHSIDYVLLPL